MAYTHALNEPLARAFLVFANEYITTKRPVNVNQLTLTHNQLANFQKLRHFGLVINIEKGYILSTKGEQFYYGETSVLNPAASMDNVTLPDDHPAWQTHARKRERITINSILPYHYKTRVDFKAEKSGQYAMFTS